MSAFSILITPYFFTKILQSQNIKRSATIDFLNQFIILVNSLGPLHYQIFTTLN